MIDSSFKAKDLIFLIGIDGKLGSVYSVKSPKLFLVQIKNTNKIDQLTRTTHLRLLIYDL